ncbi:MFS general substrate transporter [Saccharata proteae CBS 121410]|uniref:MFS general substrate transporter n=1 Tax=Saccharata proteae CBS 121410 TaxID=1314787 RepID=A0A9P4HUD6_9PEZI|nr:MFS general substrate transporter [Saccharata proteae CBS 121410]
MSSNSDERSPLLQNGDAEQQDERQQIQFSEKDTENPRAWPKNRKLANVAVIASMSILSPLASSMFTPGIPQIAEGLLTDEKTVIGATTGFVVMLGVGPLILAPLSETFGRRKLYLICFSLFTLLQIPTALSPNIATLLALRTIAGFFGAVGIANGGGTISDMFPPQERAGVFGWYLLGPLLGPTLGPLFGGVTVQRLGWRWIFWILAIVCAVNTISAFFFLRETYAPVLLAAKKKRMEEDDGSSGGSGYWYEGEDTRPFWTKIGTSLVRPIKIFSQPVVVTMSIYQALIFSTTYSLYTNFQDIYGKEYGFSTEQVGLVYLGPGIGFLIAVWFLVPQIDIMYNRLAERNDGKAKPEFRLPLANIGAFLIPVSLFWFAWTVQAHAHWLASIASTPFYGLGQVMIINCTQNYYIDSFEKYAASAIAAGAVFRSVIGGVVPLFVPGLFDSVGYGWGVSVFAFVSVALAPAPLVFYQFGGRIREKFAVDLE